jgi:hypothetical protein
VAVGVLIGLSVIFWMYVLVRGAGLALYEFDKGGQLDRDLCSCDKTEWNGIRIC